MIIMIPNHKYTFSHFKEKKWVLKLIAKRKFTPLVFFFDFRIPDFFAPFCSGGFDALFALCLMYDPGSASPEPVGE